MLTDPIADYLTRIRNALGSGHDAVDIPASRLKMEMSRILKEQGYIDPEEGIAKWRALPGEAVRAALWQHGTAAQRVLDAMTEDVWRAPIDRCTSWEPESSSAI